MMVAYSFKQQFAPAVESLVKQQTIRGARKRHAVPGEPVQLYTGMRTKACRKLVEPDPICVGTEPLEILADGSVMVGGQIIAGQELERLAIADGFADEQAFIEFFSTAYGLPFSGVLIKWKPAIQSEQAIQ